MGIAEVIPGVSGGTIAFITGIYQRLLTAIGHFDMNLIRTLRSEGIKAAWKKIDGFFLVCLLGGMATGFVFGLFVITYLLDHYPIHIWSMFFGLIIASIPLVGKTVGKWDIKRILLLVVGAAFVYWITITAPSEGPHTWWFVFISGVLGISALMLPGLSGSFVLLLLGMYSFIMGQVKGFLESPFGEETYILIAFGAGILVGLFSFAKLISWTFAKYKDGTLALLTGFLVGSLNKVWPWQEVTDIRLNSHEEKVVEFSRSVLPNQMEALNENFYYGTEAHLGMALMIMVAAAVLVYLVGRMSPEQ